MFKQFKHTVNEHKSQSVFLSHFEHTLYLPFRTYTKAPHIAHANVDSYLLCCLR